MVVRASVVVRAGVVVCAVVVVRAEGGLGSGRGRKTPT